MKTESKKIRNLIVGIVAVALVITASISVFAFGGNNGKMGMGQNFGQRNSVHNGIPSNVKGIGFSYQNNDQMKAALTQALATLVSEGKLTQAKSDALLQYLSATPVPQVTPTPNATSQPNQKRNQPPRTRMAKQPTIAGAVKSNIITQDEANAINTAVKDIQKLASQQKIKDQLNVFVTDGVLTQAKADALFTFMTTKKAAQPTPSVNSNQDKSADNRANGGAFKGIKGNGGMFAGAVSSGIITQDDANAIAKDISAKADAARQQKIAADLKTIVDKGTITEAQATSVMNALNAQEDARKAEMAALQGKTKQEQMDYFKQNVNTKKVDPIATLVDQKVLTQEQATAIKAVLFPQKNGGAAFGKQGSMQPGSGNRGMNNFKKQPPAAAPTN